MSVNVFGTSGAAAVCGDVARKTHITTRRNAAERVPLAVLEMRDANHWSLRLLRELSRVTGEALICVQIGGVALDRMRNERRLIRIIAPPPHIVGDLALHGRRRRFLGERGRTGEARRVAVCWASGAPTKNKRPRRAAGNKPRITGRL